MHTYLLGIFQQISIVLMCCIFCRPICLLQFPDVVPALYQFYFLCFKASVLNPHLSNPR